MHPWCTLMLFKDKSIHWFGNKTPICMLWWELVAQQFPFKSFSRYCAAQCIGKRPIHVQLWTMCATSRQKWPGGDRASVNDVIGASTGLLSSDHSGRFFSSATDIRRMSQRNGKCCVHPCFHPMYELETHVYCLVCLGEEHAVLALETGECKHCELLSVKMLWLVRTIFRLHPPFHRRAFVLICVTNKRRARLVCLRCHQICAFSLMISKHALVLLRFMRRMIYLLGLWAMSNLPLSIPLARGNRSRNCSRWLLTRWTGCRLTGHANRDV